MTLIKGGHHMDHGASSYRRYLEGDEEAFDEIIKDLFDGLVCFVDRYVQDLAAAEDIAIDVFADLLVHKHRYNFKVTLKTYLFMLGRSRALNYIKHRSVLQCVALEVAEQIGDMQADLESAVFADARKKMLSAAIGQLGEEMRIAVHLIYFEELTYDEAAKVMRKNRKQIDNLLYRAKKELRAILGEEGKQLI